MERHFDEEIQELTRDMRTMGELAQEAIRKSIEALQNADLAKAQEVIEQDDRVDEQELLIDEKCIDLMARYQPMAGDLRFLATAMKINGELERIADLAVDIAQRVLELAGKSLVKPLEDIPRLSVIAQTMVSQSIESFINRDVELAKKVVLSDAEADRLRNKVQEDLVRDYMVKDARTVPSAVPLLLIARHLERMCDHTTNIAEEVIYIVDAKVVRHHRENLE
ncbi:MAG: phosphate signaling complex protein PhoU [Candidatus Omnitrophica bacterium]|nr:phosphate signaling complex protein PhoU [Candidatus Omnitrophota bacterium]